MFDMNVSNQVIDELKKCAIALRSLAKHLPGQHDQSEHAHGGGGGATEFPEGGYSGLKMPKMSREDRALFNEYQFNSSEINGYMREGIGNAPEPVQQLVIKMKKVFDKYAVETKQDMVVYRGVEKGNVPTEGKFSDSAFGSTSTKITSAGFFGDQVMKINVPKGSKVLPILGGEESEVILAPYRTYKAKGKVGSFVRRGSLCDVYEYDVF